MIFEQYLGKAGKVSLILQYFNCDEKITKQENCIVYFKGQQLSKKQFENKKQYAFSKETEKITYPENLILTIDNEIQGKFIFSNSQENSFSQRFFIGVEFYQNKNLVLKIFNNEIMTKEFSENFQDFLVRALIKTNFEENYEIKSFLGRGGFSYVHLGICKQNGNTVAVKKIEKLRLMQIKQGPELIYQEILIMKKLQHPNIVKLLDVYQSKHYYYLIMEYLEGPTLQNSFQSKFNSLLKIQQFCKKFLLLLKYLEGNNILHRDIKPANIVFKSKNAQDVENFCLIDFGLAISINSQNEFYKSYGTVGYIAPELLNNNIDKKQLLKADIYSFGCILFLLYFQKNVFRGNYEKVALQNANNDLPFFTLNNQNHDTPQNNYLCTLLKKILTNNSQKRISLNDLLLHPFFGIVNNEMSNGQNDSDFQLENIQEYENNFVVVQMEQLGSLMPKFKFSKQKQFAKEFKEFDQSTEFSVFQLSTSKKWQYSQK